jgi:phytoene dehydrogenase-like protein
MYVFGFLEAYGFGVARGGAGKLTDALIACIREHGGEVLAMPTLRVRGDGRARASMVDGRSFAAKDAVIGAIIRTCWARMMKAWMPGPRRCGGHAHHQRGLHHRACSAVRAAALPYQTDKWMRDGGDAATSYTGPAP